METDNKGLLAKLINERMRDFGMIDTGLSEAVAEDLDSVIHHQISMHLNLHDTASQILSGMYANPQFEFLGEHNTYDHMAQIATMQALQLCKHIAVLDDYRKGSEGAKEVDYGTH